MGAKGAGHRAADHTPISPTGAKLHKPGLDSGAEASGLNGGGPASYADIYEAEGGSEKKRSKRMTC